MKKILTIPLTGEISHISFNKPLGKARKERGGLGEAVFVEGIAVFVEGIAMRDTLGNIYEDNLHLLWIKERFEWVGLISHRDYEFPKSGYDENLCGPYRLDEILAEKILEAYSMTIEDFIQSYFTIYKTEPHKKL